MNFGEALEVLKSGRRVRRAGWSGVGMWLALTPGSTIPAARANPGSAAGELAIKERVIMDPTTPPIVLGAHIDMRAADGTLVIGWAAPQTDILAEDWVSLS